MPKHVKKKKPQKKKPRPLAEATHIAQELFFRRECQREAEHGFIKLLTREKPKGNRVQANPADLFFSDAAAAESPYWDIGPKETRALFELLNNQ